MIAQELKQGDILALHGDLGAGKTTLVKSIIETLTSTPSREVQSPTFIYLHTYEAPMPIFHFDLYRLQNSEMFIQMGFLDCFDEKGICLIEWAEKITSLLPLHTLHLQFTHLEEDKRRIDVYKS